MARAGTLAIACFALSLGCSGGTTDTRTTAPLGSVTLSGARLDVRQLAGKPRLVVLAREGDPAAALAAAVHAPGDAEALALLGEVLRARLATRGARVQVAADVVLIAMDVDTPAESLATLTAALIAPVRPAEEAKAREARPTLARVRAAELATALACSGRLVAGPASFPYASGRAEALRSRAVTAETVALGFAGPDEIAESLTTSLDKAESWPAPRPVESKNAAPRLETGATIASDLSAGVRLRIAFRTSAPGAAVAAARRLGEDRRPIHALASEAGLKLSEVVGAATPSGGCLALSLTSSPEAPVQSGATAADAGRELHARAEAHPDPSALATLVRALGPELSREVAEPFSEDLAAREVVSAKDPADAATLAAWWALAGSGSGSALAAVSAELPTDADAARLAAFDSAVDQASRGPSAPSSRLTVASRVEKGQRDVWVLLADPCAAVEEPPHLWGSAAIAVRAAEPAAADEDGDVRAFVSPSGVGFVARATPRPDESPADTARRAADLAARTYFSDPPSTESLLRAQESVRRDIERAWGRGAPGLQAHATSSMDPPAVLEPFGPPGDTAKRGAWELSRRLRALARDPLKIAILANEDEAQARAAADEAARWLGAGTARSCAKPAAARAPARNDVTGPPRGPSRAHVTLPPADPALVAFTAHLLGRPDGLLSKALAPVAGAKASARAAGPPGATMLVIDISAPTEGVEEALRLVSALLSRLARGEIPDGEIVAARQTFARAERETLGDPVARLTRLFEGATPAPRAAPAPAAFRAFSAQALSPERLVVTVVRPE